MDPSRPSADCAVPKHARGSWLESWLRLFAALVMLACVAGARAAPAWLLTVQGPIGPAAAEYLSDGLAKARAAQAPVVVVALDTPGGLDTSMRQMIQAVLASPVPVAIYVWPSGARAASAGTYLLYAAHVAAMAPATTLGAATPVPIGLPGLSPRAPPAERPASAGASAPARGPEPTDAMSAKQVHDAAAFIRALATQRGRNAQWAERAVREAVSLTAEEALRENVIDVVASDVPDLLARIDGRRVEVAGRTQVLATRGLAVQSQQPDWRHRALGAIAHPGVALILMMLGIYGLLFEFSAPGFGIAGVAGAICLLLGLFALQLLPVNVAGLALMAVAIALWVAEALSPSFGVLGVGGIAAFIAGAVLLFDRDVPGFELPLSVVAGIALASALLTVAAGRLALRARGQRVTSGREELVGAPGTVLEVEADAVWARVHGERWRVSCPAPLHTGQAVRVTSVDGLTLQVRPETEPARRDLSQGATP